MFWVIVFLVLSLGGVVFLAFYVRWLMHKASDVFSELEMLQTRVAELAELLGQIRTPDRTDLSLEPAQKKVSTR